MEINVVRWHGDAPHSAKKKLLRDPRGIALITPESVEAMFVRRATDALRLFGKLEFVVVDELHAFLQGPRGLHLASLLRRIDEISKIRPRRIGLSATIGDLDAAARWLNPEHPDSVALVESSAAGSELRLQVRGYVEPPGEDGVDDLESVTGEADALDRIADHLFSTLRGTNNLIFAGSRRSVESLADRLRFRSEGAGVPNEFLPHHGSLSRELREELEARLKKGDLPTTAIATTTLELGIDIGSVNSVAQLGAPRSIASLRQRLGRSGRRKGVPAVLRVYVREKHLTPDTDPLDRLRLEVARAAAAVRLLVEHFVEPPRIDPAVATVALHQTLSIIVERGGQRAKSLYDTICGGGPLSIIGQSGYVDMLRGMASPESRLIEQAPDGTIMLGEVGEKLTSQRDFYAIFETDQEWRLVHAGHALGTIPISNAVGIGSMLAFAGRRWRVVVVDDRAKVLEVTPHPLARIPRFDRTAFEPLHDRLVAEMKAVYLTAEVPLYLNEQAADLLQEGRRAFRALGLDRERLVQSGKDTHVLLWRGTAFNSAFSIGLSAVGFECSVHDIGLTVSDAAPNEVLLALQQMAAMPSISPYDLAEKVGNLRTAKYDNYVPTRVLRYLWAQRNDAIVGEIAGVASSLTA